MSPAKSEQGKTSCLEREKLHVLKVKKGMEVDKAAQLDLRLDTWAKLAQGLDGLSLQQDRCFFAFAFV